VPATIEGNEYPVMKIFSDDFAFSIPRYQRPYAWTTEHAGELLDDFLTFMGEDGRPIEELDPYFLGSIVLIKTKNIPASEVVDGQQRLTTLAILLAALRATTDDRRFAEDLTEFLYAKGNSVSGIPEKYRLTLRERDAGFFREYIQAPEDLSRLEKMDPAQLSDSRQHIQASARLFLEGLRSLDEQQRRRLAWFIIRRCYMVVVSTQDLNSAYRIFSVLNDRGLDLSHTDILKAEIIGNIPEEQQDRYTQKWEDQEERLGRERFAELFAHIRMVHRKAKLRDTILKELREYVKPAANPQAFIDTIMLPLADAFDLIKTETYQSTHRAQEINGLFRWLNQIDNFDWVPPAILYLSRHNDDDQSLLAFFTDLERLAAGLMIRRANINERIERYARLLTAIENNENLYTPNSPLQLTEEERRGIVSTLDGDIYQISRIRLYVLLRLDHALSEGSASYNYRVVTVEHVLPQNPPPNSQWLRWFPVPEQREQYVHRLCNLVLLSRSKNSQAQNYDFEEKKKRYFNTREGISPFVLTTQVLQKEEWTPAILEKRQHELLSKLKKVWRL